MRVAPGVVPAQAHPLEVPADALLPDAPLAPAVLAVRLGQEPLTDDVVDRHAWVERAIGVLVDHLEPTAQAAQLLALRR